MSNARLIAALFAACAFIIGSLVTMAYALGSFARAVAL